MRPFEIQSVIETPSLRLRPPRLNDAGRLAKLLNDFEVARMTTSIPHPYGIEDAEQFLRDASRETFVVEHPDHGPIGTVGFSEGEGRRAELGYWIGKPYWGCGFATEAARAPWAGRSRSGTGGMWRPGTLSTTPPPARSCPSPASSIPVR